MRAEVARIDLAIDLLPCAISRSIRRIFNTVHKKDARGSTRHLESISGRSTRAGALQGTITGLSYPSGLFVDARHNLWVADYAYGKSAGNILEFARGGTSPIKTLSDNEDYPVSVTICNHGTVYVSNFGSRPHPYIGSISVYANGATSPTGTLRYPGQHLNYFLTCDAAGNVFTTLNISRKKGETRVVEYPGGHQSGATVFSTSGIQIPGGIKPDNAGNLLINDQEGARVCEYTEAGSLTGTCISTGSGGWFDIAVTRDGNIVAGTYFNEGTSLLFPSGAHRQTYLGPEGTYSGIAFDPGQKGLGD